MGVARRAIRLRAYPTRAQQDQILVSCAGAAYVWNKALEWRESAFQLGSRMPGVYEMDRLLPTGRTTGICEARNTGCAPSAGRVTIAT